MKVLKKVKKFTLILSVFMCFYAEIVLAEAMLMGKDVPYIIPVTGIVLAWLSLMYYANVVSTGKG